jgi:hypothetical protein
MTFKVTLVGAQPHETTPAIAVYAVDAQGRPSHKIGAVADGRLAISHDHTGVIAFGPDVADASSIDPQGFVPVRLADQLPIWERAGGIDLPASWWRGWLGFQICLSGTVTRCTPFRLPLPVLRSIALGQRPIIFPEHCVSVCNGVVEVWESTTCCWPLPIYEVPNVISKLTQFLAQNPVMFPVPPRPDPGPVSRALASNVDQALAAGRVATSFLPSTELAEHLQTLQSLSAQDAVSYIDLHPILWPFHCTTSAFMLGETPLNPDGSFSYCYRQFPFVRLGCRTSYFYKVKQFTNGVPSYIYDGSAAQQYFSADQSAALTTQTGTACVRQSQIPPGSVTLQAIGQTQSWWLDSHWNGMDASGTDLTQTGPLTLPIGSEQDAGLVLPGTSWSAGAPWTGTLWLSLNIDPAVQAAGAVYYRFSTVQVDLAGNPIGTPAPIPNAISWYWLDDSVSPNVTRTQQLGPVTPAGSPNSGLFTIPYPADHDWIGNASGPAGLFHQFLDTTTLASAYSSPGAGNGRYLLITELFDVNGNRLAPDAANAAAGDVVAPFNFVRLLGAPPSPTLPGPVSTVPYPSLAHLIWVDNRPVHGNIGYFQSSGGTQECQFIQALPTDSFSVGYYAYHAVMCDAAPSPVPSSSFMAGYSMGWEEGLNGPTGSLIVPAGGDVNQPNTCPLGTAYADTAGISFATLLAGQPRCAFSITLTVSAKHTDGTSGVSPLSYVASVALSDA